MTLIERDEDVSALVTLANRARAGHGGMVVMTGEAGAGKSSILEEFTRRTQSGLRVLWGACDPLATPRPLGPVFDVAAGLAASTRSALAHAEHAYQIFDAITSDLASEPTLLVIDDVHWADQGTADLLRHLLRRIRNSPVLVVLSARTEESNDTVRALLGDIARTAGATSIAVRPLTVEGVAELIGDADLDPVGLHRLTAGNAFFVTQMIEHRGHDLPTTVRDAVLARTVGLDPGCWDVLHLLTCAPGPIVEAVLEPLGVTSRALRRLHELQLIRRTDRGVGFHHDLCRLAMREVIPPGAEPELHRRLLDVYDAVGGTDPVIVAHHAEASGDRDRLRAAAISAARYSARSGAHRQSAQFYRLALANSHELGVDAGAGTGTDDAELLEALAAECYLIDRLDEAIDAGERALAIRAAAGDAENARALHNALAVYHWYNANRSAADEHVYRAIASADGAASVALGHAFAMRAHLAMQSGLLDRARDALEQAREIARATAADELRARVAIITGVCDVLEGVPAGRDAVLGVLARGPAHLDEIYSSGYSNLTYLDVEQRRLGDAGELLARSIEMTVERDLPVCRAWQMGSRSRLRLIGGDWDAALADSSVVLDESSAPLAQFWPLVVRGLIRIRTTAEPASELDTAWELAARYGEPLRVVPAAAALVEQQWLTGIRDDRLAGFPGLLERDTVGVQWARGDLAVWLARVGIDTAADAIAPPYRSWLDGDRAGAADQFDRGGSAYDGALARVESKDQAAVADGLATLDRLGAHAVADKLRRDLRAAGMPGVPARRRRSTLAHPAGLTTRQQEVLALMGAGLTNGELAGRLFLSEKTVDHHVSAILTRLGVGNRRDAVRRGRELGIVD